MPRGRVEGSRPREDEHDREGEIGEGAGEEGSPGTEVRQYETREGRPDGAREIDLDRVETNRCRQTLAGHDLRDEGGRARQVHRVGDGAQHQQAQDGLR